MIKKLAGICLVVAFASCGDLENKQAHNYFDLKAYFKKEAMRLNKVKPLVNKTVEIDTSRETQKLKIADWEKELDIFASADINKNSWGGLFKVEKTATSEVYTTSNEKVQVKKLVISKKGSSVWHIAIIINNDNSIYHSTDTLDYYPDSLYSIVKTQRIKLMAAKKYRVTGKF